MNRVFTAIFNRLTIGVPYLWLIIFFLVPFAIVFKISLSETAIQMPPYNPVFDGTDTAEKLRVADRRQLHVPDGRPALLPRLSVLIFTAGIATFIALLIGFPLAYGMARAPSTLRPTLLMLVILPFWTSFLIRVYAWIGILKPEGLLNQLLDHAQHHRHAAEYHRAPMRRSISASSIPTCPSWCCRSIRRWKRWIIR